MNKRAKRKSAEAGAEAEPPPPSSASSSREVEKEEGVKEKNNKRAKKSPEPEYLEDQHNLIVSPFPPSDKIREYEELVPMKQVKMDRTPYIPPEERDSLVDRLKPQILTLTCNQRRVALRHVKIDRVKKFEFYLPYFHNPLPEDVPEQETVVRIIFPAEPKPVFCEFDWDMDELEEFTEGLINEEALSEEQEDAFKEFVREKVREAKKS